MSRSLRLVWIVCAVLSSAVMGCSAIVAPDPSRLGGADVPGADGGDLDGSIDGGGIDGGADGGGADGGGPDAPSECSRPEDCDDGIDCTRSRCEAGACRFEPDDGACGDRERCAAGLGCVPARCTDDASCADGDACNGVERCLPGTPGADEDTGCAPGVELDCNDGIACTDDACNPATGCVHERDDGFCDDGIDCTSDVCSATAGPSGCEFRPDDSLCGDACTVGAVCSVMLRRCTPGMPRMCNDGNACTVDFCSDASGGCGSAPLDADMDGASAARTASGATCTGGTDCNDMRADVRPGATEVCNGVDDNCNGSTDEGCSTVPEDCATARPLTPVAGMAGVYRDTGSFGALRADYDACSGAGTDAVYYLDVTTASDVRIDTMGSAVLDTVLGVGLTCDEANFGRACNDDQDPGSSTTAVLTSRIWVHNVAPPAFGSRRIYILVKAFSGSAAGGYTLNVNVTPVRADSCTEPLDITGGGLVVGWVTPGAAAFGPSGSCDPSPTFDDREAVFRFRGPSDGQLYNVTASSAEFAPILYTRSSCTMSSTESACDADSARAVITAVPAPSGVLHYAFVDGVPPISFSAAYSLSFDP